jgi:hypothetical protein
MTRVSPERRSQPRTDDPELRGRRSEPRAYVVLPASAEALSGRRQVRLLDVSRSGARIEGSDLPETGKEIILKCGSIDTFGMIVWSADGRCGVRFDEEIPLRYLPVLRALSDTIERSPMTPEEREAAADWVNGLAR